MNKLKAIFHIIETERWQRTLNNVNNFIKDSGQDNVIIEVVANGAAVAAFFRNHCSLEENKPTGAASCGIEKADLVGEMKRLSQMGVGFTACRNALKMHDLDEKSLPGFVSVVPAGITEIIKKQTEGYAYYKA